MRMNNHARINIHNANFVDVLAVGTAVNNDEVAWRRFMPQPDRDLHKRGVYAKTRSTDGTSRGTAVDSVASAR